VRWKPYLILVAHVLLALVYTTPWDNYLVATQVWSYDPELVMGINLGWVPIEEYTFFVAQTLLTGLWMLAVTRYVFRASPRVSPSRAVRWRASVATVGLWTISTGLFVAGWGPGTYLTLILSWALIPVLTQVAFGADILLAHSRRLLLAIVAPTLYLWLVDAIAISSGTWTINPSQTTGLKLGVLPVEEMLFFLMTNLIIVFGVTLMRSEVSQARARAMLARLKETWQDRRETRLLSS
jgi:lycopene cyclase domain-containing protein